jgi:hypothetical protein
VATPQKRALRRGACSPAFLRAPALTHSRMINLLVEPSVCEVGVDIA